MEDVRHTRLTNFSGKQQFMSKIHAQYRRKVLRSLAVFGVGLASPRLVTTAHAARGVDGFDQQDWFRETTFDLRRDQERAEADGKMLTLIWEQAGCTYCRRMHRVAFQQPAIVGLIKANFYVVQMDIWGDRKFVDFEGDRKKESMIASGYFVRATPTTQFLDDIGDEVFRIPGYARPAVFELAYRYVVERGYDQASFKDWVKSQRS